MAENVGALAERVDHVGIRITDIPRALDFYARLGFEKIFQDEVVKVINVRNAHGIDLNLDYTGDGSDGGVNMLTDGPGNYTGITHVALRVPDLDAVEAALKEANIPITRGPVKFPDGASLFGVCRVGQPFVTFATEVKTQRGLVNEQNVI